MGASKRYILQHFQERAQSRILTPRAVAVSNFLELEPDGILGSGLSRIAFLEVVRDYAEQRRLKIHPEVYNDVNTVVLTGPVSVAGLKILASYRFTVEVAPLKEFKLLVHAIKEREELYLPLIESGLQGMQLDA